MKTFIQFINEARTAESDKAFFDRIRRQAAASGDKFPELTAAQAAIESGYGTSQSGKNNVFGQKGKGTTRRTREVVNGRDVNIDAEFQDFDSEEDSTKNRVKKWSYKYGDAKDLESAARNLQLPPGARIPGTNQTSHGVYATDPNYVSTLTRIAREQGGSGKSGSASSTPTSTPPAPKEPVLSKLKGVAGTGKGKENFVVKKWSDAEGERYKAYGGK
jgi:flagellum-specific peptidoglycan hydrolase FlgJ